MADLPGQVNVTLKRGQAVFWGGKIIHRGRKPEEVERRLSIAGSFAKNLPEEPGEETADHWRRQLNGNIREYLPEALRLRYDRWRALPGGVTANARGPLRGPMGSYTPAATANGLASRGAS